MIYCLKLTRPSSKVLKVNRKKTIEDEDEDKATLRSPIRCHLEADQARLEICYKLGLSAICELYDAHITMGFAHDICSRQRERPTE